MLGIIATTLGLASCIAIVLLVKYAPALADRDDRRE